MKPVFKGRIHLPKILHKWNSSQRQKTNLFHLNQLNTAQFSKLIAKFRKKLLPNLVHVTLWIAANILALPFAVEGDLQSGQLWLKKPNRVRTWLMVLVQLNVLMQVIFTYSVAFWDQDFHVAIKGMLTMDSIIYFLVVLLGGSAMRNSGKMFYERNSIIAQYNSFAKALKDFSDKHLDGYHVFQIYERDITLQLVWLMVSLAAMSAPSSSAVAVIVFRRSPFLISNLLPEQLRKTVRGRILVALSLAHSTIFLAIGGYVILGIMALVMEGTFQAILFLRTLRCPELGQSMTYEMKKFHHAQLELMAVLVNDWIGNTAPICVLCMFCCTVIPTILLAKVSRHMGIPLPIIIPGLLGLIVLPSTVGFCGLRQCEMIRNESIGYIHEFSRQAAAEENPRRAKRNKISRVFRRSFRRRPLGVRLGIFMQIDSGLGVDFIQHIVKNAISLIFMVETCHPITLLGERSTGQIL